MGWLCKIYFIQTRFCNDLEGRYNLNTAGVWVSPLPKTRPDAKGLFYSGDNDRAISTFDFAEVFTALDFEH